MALAGHQMNTDQYILMTICTFCSIKAMTDSSHFFYFGYGSNLNEYRIRLNSPSAEFHCIAKLDNYKLAFANNQYGQSKLWHGATATIIRDKGNHLWGAVWILSNENLKSLDRFEFIILHKLQ